MRVPSGVCWDVLARWLAGCMGDYRCERVSMGFQSNVNREGAWSAKGRRCRRGRDRGGRTHTGIPSSHHARESEEGALRQMQVVVTTSGTLPARELNYLATLTTLILPTWRPPYAVVSDTRGWMFDIATQRREVYDAKVVTSKQQAEAYL